MYLIPPSCSRTTSIFGKTDFGLNCFDSTPFILMKRYLGLSLIVVAIMLLLAGYVLDLTRMNAMLLIPFFLLLTGLFLHVFAQKRDSKY